MHSGPAMSRWSVPLPTAKQNLACSKGRQLFEFLQSGYAFKWDSLVVAFKCLVQEKTMLVLIKTSIKS